MSTTAPSHASAEAAFDWQDPLHLAAQLSEDERLVSQAARDFCQANLMPRIRDAQERLMGAAFTPGERRQLMDLATRLRRTLAEIVTPVVPPRPGP